MIRTIYLGVTSLERREKNIQMTAYMYGSIYVEIYWDVNDMEIDNCLSRIAAEWSDCMSTESPFPLPPADCDNEKPYDVTTVI